MDMSLTTVNEAAAAQLLQLVSSQIAIMQLQKPETADAMRKLKLAAEGATVRASLELTREELEQSFHAMEATRGIAGTALAQPGAPRTTQPPPPPPGKIRIYGLDEGVREIPLTR